MWDSRLRLAKIAEFGEQGIPLPHHRPGRWSAQGPPWALDLLEGLADRAAGGRGDEGEGVVGLGDAGLGVGMYQ